jgi:hypothetical protein
MPIREAIVDTVLPKSVEKPIPTRTVITRPQQRPQNINQPTTSVAAQAAEPAPEESVRLSPQLSALARKEQAYRQREQALKEREKALEAKLAEADKYSQLREKAAAKDFSAFEELGLDYETYTKNLLDRQQSEDPTSKRIAELEEQIKAFTKAQEENASKEYEETVAEYRREITKLLDTSDEFPKTKKANKGDAVLKLIVDSWDEDGVQMTVEEAARDVEKFLNDEAKAWASLIEEPAAELAESAQALPPPKPMVRTITQQLQPSGMEKRPVKSLQHLSDEERYAEARRRVQERKQLQGR